MDDTTQQHNNQDPHANSTTDDLAAMLGFITSISEMHMQEAQQPQSIPQTPQNAPQQTQPQETHKPAPKQETGALGDIKAARKDTGKGDIGGRLDDIEKELETLIALEKKDESTQTTATPTEG